MPPNEPPIDSEWVEFDRVQWLHDNLSPEAADALARLITEDGPCTIAGYVPMSAQLGAEVQLIADAHAGEVAILDAHFRATD